MDTLKIHGFSTGQIQVKSKFLRPEPQNLLGSLRSFLDRQYSAPLPVWCWLIEHPSGLIVVDTGLTCTARSNWFSRTQTRLHYTEHDRLSRQMQRAGFDPAQVRVLILTHLHIDHDRGMGDFPEAHLLVSARELRDYRSPLARLMGYSAPTWKSVPHAAPFLPLAHGPFRESADVMGDGRVLLLPTPGHTPGHLSVLVRQPGHDILLAGDLTYSEQDLRTGRLGGIVPSPHIHRKSMRQVRQLAQLRPLIYLPSHDPDSLRRLQRNQPFSLT
ncbi:quorum-quenching N-acyl homoserine lactonase QqlR [Deinococcus radiodurans]|uniref:Metallo-beta-lactamase domain-containing protein n=1 Tax=Deinococcus radiodurans (strain ATCC 13939 / DSM 20539 / JCM 16871 / CCUG 27074 / LMG 4051 / NBRC 15346 / NCIMB 9279 / VKM B-1422 / R1) TaxID=243230 RepID=Q9RXY2_DEIRA|nr:N-acyl homoserine lactonase QqlR [Deinococcus radiodurans]AAF09759.1 conserved hypothetical protein [Deinococcus radiodurans R1 = ATCC 13939 = DSM 20539]ANC72550.1 hypothetical protein A2G07_12670 [Deinococcus radiodurans R1 = ATCC 13939 = DSM 20539]QEM72137.1 N-acyl homoserine lactonase family protein [Deinococcus radiodurans]QIP28403.1 N-acyl homoserine lactonase family protein [Deinococcus radiodurans]QIP32879.1 N-acyl homoserine lactonase family protein [Deinococcus radiodurans]